MKWVGGRAGGRREETGESAEGQEGQVKEKGCFKR